MGKGQRTIASDPGLPAPTTAPPDELPNLAPLLEQLAEALAQRHPFLSAPAPNTLGIGQNDAGLMAWAILAGLNPNPAMRPTLAQWLETERRGEVDPAADLRPPPAPQAVEDLLERGIGALAEMERSGDLEGRLSKALVSEGEETPPPLSAGTSGYQELAASLELLDPSLSISGVLEPVAQSLARAFSAGSIGDRASPEYLLDASPGNLFDNVLALDDLYQALPLATTATFDLNEDGFTFVDDSFRGTSEPAYADGIRIGAGGFSGGALRVDLGGIDNNNILGMSGGWERPITLTETSQFSVNFRYQLTHSADHESDEYAEVLVSLDGVLYGSGVNDYVARITGDGNGGPDLTTGWQAFTVDFGQLVAGTYNLVLGGHSNKKTYNNEWTEVLIDEVIITETGPLIVGPAGGVLANDDAGNNPSPSATVLIGPSNGTVNLGADGSFTYAPDTNFLGLDSFTYRLSGTQSSDSAQVIIEVGNIVQGTGVAETLTGTAARDALLGLGGDDTLTAGAGDDRLTGGSGADLLNGGGGADIFAFAGGDGGAVLALADTIADFDDGIDRIGLSGDLNGLSIAGGGLTVTDDGGGNAVITVAASSEILTIVTGAFGAISDSDFVDL